MSSIPVLFRVTIEVADLDDAARIYGGLFGIEGRRQPGARHYFDAGAVVLSVIDVAQGGLQPRPIPKSLAFYADDLDELYQRAAALEVLADYEIHGEPAGQIVSRPWGERSFYVVDPWGNDLCFCQAGTLYR